MQIISKVEINYFRSVYSISLLKNNDVNILIGGNDSGKSNILKALNLFFNNETELNSPFYFNDDLSRLREKEARSAKGRASVWIKVTFNNFLNWKSLPKQFSIKRTWNRYEDRPVDTYSGDLPATTIGRFLNKISFHYIPAVRGRDIFAHYLDELHDSLIDDEKAGVRQASVKLLESINQSTKDMSEKISLGLNIDSSIQVPENLRQLFSVLDFSTKFSGYDIPLQKRGDGIQARHIPFILDFIARHSSKSHIWAYEEPESSLELSKAFELAEQFSKDFSNENQIYLTTHSPAFYDLSGPHINKWLVKSVDNTDEFYTDIKEVKDTSSADENLGIAALISTRAKELYIEITNLNSAHSALEKKLAKVNLTQIIVEGPTDKEILEIAFQKLFPDEDLFCEFICAEGADNLTYNLKSFNTLEKEYPFSIVGLYDNDQKGRSEYKNFNRYKFVGGDLFREINSNKRLFCGLLPIPEELKIAANFYKEKTRVDFELPLCIEYMFPHNVITEAVQKKILVLKDAEMTVKSSTGMQLPLNMSIECSKHLPSDYYYLAYEIDNASKKIFSQWVKSLDANQFKPFQSLFVTLKQLQDIN